MCFLYCTDIQFMCFLYFTGIQFMCFLYSTDIQFMCFLHKIHMCWHCDDKIQMSYDHSEIYLINKYLRIVSIQIFSLLKHILFYLRYFIYLITMHCHFSYSAIRVLNYPVEILHINALCKKNCIRMHVLKWVQAPGHAAFPLYVNITRWTQRFITLLQSWFYWQTVLKSIIIHGQSLLSL